MKCFVGNKRSSFSISSVDLEVDPGHSINVEAYFGEIDASFTLANVGEIMDNISKAGYKTLCSIPKEAHDVKVFGILGVDTIQQLKVFSSIKCLQGVAFQLSAGCPLMGILIISNQILLFPLVILLMVCLN